MGHVARLRSRRGYGHRRQSQRPRNARLRRHPGRHGQQRAGTEDLWLARDPHQRRERRGPCYRAIRPARGCSMRLTSTSKAAIPNEVSGLSWPWIFQPRWGVLALPLLLALAPTTRAEYIVLRSGERIHVTGYQV